MLPYFIPRNPLSTSEVVQLRTGNFSKYDLFVMSKRLLCRFNTEFGFTRDPKDGDDISYIKAYPITGKEVNQEELDTEIELITSYLPRHVIIFSSSSTIEGIEQDFIKSMIDHIQVDETLKPIKSNGKIYIDLSEFLELEKAYHDVYMNIVSEIKDMRYIGYRTSSLEGWNLSRDDLYYHKDVNAYELPNVTLLAPLTNSSRHYLASMIGQYEIIGNSIKITTISEQDYVRKLQAVEDSYKYNFEVVIGNEGQYSYFDNGKLVWSTASLPA
jgi:hypothetical protein